MKQSSKLLVAIWAALFRHKPIKIGKREYLPKKIKGLNAFVIGNLLFIEQNPKTATKWARLAKKGTKIMWVIDRKLNKYLFRVVNGKVKKVKKV